MGEAETSPTPGSRPQNRQTRRRTADTEVSVHLSSNEFRIHKFIAKPAEEADVRKAFGALPDTVGEGDDATELHAYIRGSALYLMTRGRGDPFERMRSDATTTRALDTLREHASYVPGEERDFALAPVVTPREPSTAAPGVVLVLPVLGSADRLLGRALADVPPDALAAAGVTHAFVGEGDLALVTSHADVAGFVDALASAPAGPLVRVLETLTAFEDTSPAYFALRPLRDAGKTVPPGVTGKGSQVGVRSR